MTLRVRLVSFDDAPAIGGQGVVVARLREELSSRGISVDTIAGHGRFGVHFFRVTGRAPLDFSLMINRLGKALWRDVDLVHVQGGPGGVLLLKNLPIPVVYSANHTYSQAHPSFGLRRGMGSLEARAYQRAAHVVAISASTAREVERMGVSPDRVSVISPGIDTVERDITVERDPRRVLFVGRWESEKGVLDALETIDKIAATHPGLSLGIIGSGRLEHLVRERAASVRGDVEILGNVSSAVVRRQMAQASLLLVPSRYEGLGLVALEAASMGTIPVGYDVPGLVDALAGVGVAVSDATPGGLALAVTTLLDDPAKLDAMRLPAQQVVQERYSWTRNIERIIDIYHQVLGTSRMSKTISVPAPRPTASPPHTSVTDA